MTGGPTGGRGPPTVLEFLMINFKLTFGSFSLVVFHILLLLTVASP